MGGFEVLLPDGRLCPYADHGIDADGALDEDDGDEGFVNFDMAVIGSTIAVCGGEGLDQSVRGE